MLSSTDFPDFHYLSFKLGNRPTSEGCCLSELDVPRPVPSRRIFLFGEMNFSGVAERDGRTGRSALLQTFGTDPNLLEVPLKKNVTKCLQLGASCRKRLLRVTFKTYVTLATHVSNSHSCRVWTVWVLAESRRWGMKSATKNASSWSSIVLMKHNGQQICSVCRMEWHLEIQTTICSRMKTILEVQERQQRASSLWNWSFWRILILYATQATPGER